MAAIARSQTASCALPVLDVFTSAGGALVDVFSAEFQVFDATGPAPVQVYPTTPGARAPVDVNLNCPAGGRLGVGHYAGVWTVPADANVGAYEARWFIKLASGPAEQTYSEAFEVLPEITINGSPEPNYVTVAEMRAEGVPMSVTDAWLLQRIGIASRMIEQATGRFFVPRYLAFRLDGRGERYLAFDTPIIALEAVSYNGDEPYSVDDFVVYNRHLRGFTNPDDRDSPLLELVGGARFYAGRQNIWVTGLFGYTDPDPPNPYGKTPDLIKYACKMLVVRELSKIADIANRFEASVRGRITSERTRDQAYTLEPKASQNQGVVYTGDAEIDRILAAYRRPPVFGAV